MSGLILGKTMRSALTFFVFSTTTIFIIRCSLKVSATIKMTGAHIAYCTRIHGCPANTLSQLIHHCRPPRWLAVTLFLLMLTL